MKKSWHSPTGLEQTDDQAQPRDWFNLMLTPFFVCWLILSQVADVTKYLIFRLDAAADQVFYRVSIIIDKLPYSLSTKYRLMVAAAWLPTAILGITFIWTVSIFVTKMIDTPHEINIDEMTLEDHLAESRIVQIGWPEELREVSGSATVTLSEDELMELAGKFSEMSEEKIQDLSQSELVNLALVYYYFGNEANYRQYLEMARMMDPNERYLAK